ncbi:MAG TPA: response regulator [Bacteroidia bacterium]|jgi:CheY-like chemotaxis protein|nr:response regulator [Bacteroidia bacterium]
MNALKNVEILLVEDNPNDAEMTIRALRKYNLANKLHHVKDGAEALDFIFRNGEYKTDALYTAPKLIILDLKLPKVDGLEVLRAIKADAKTRTIPVVIMTSSREEKDVIDGYALGVNSYVVKPVGFESFMQAVAELGLYWMLLNEDPRKP